eukprot:TRINITY_DN4620_c0_g1_i1.p1 TRINITY_DN4620_c0_g1~~TRINITY_DN4620_c0_g1_i1.p1  ORF type:complete len:283 (+),score=33.59 TRINITY_DN4620_c0_g1_i1:143-991(+)
MCIRDRNQMADYYQSDSDSKYQSSENESHLNDESLQQEPRKKIHQEDEKKFQFDNKLRSQHYSSKLPLKKKKAKQFDKQSKKQIPSKLLKEPTEIFLYKPSVPLPDLSQFLNSLIEIRVSSEYLNLENSQLRKRQIWGSDIYSSHSDIVCILQHSSLEFDITQVPKDIAGVAIFCKVTKTRKQYSSSTRNGIQSQAYKNYQGFSLKPDYFTWLTTLGRAEDLQKWASKMPISCVSHRKKIPPINSKLIKKLPENNIVFNMCNDVAFKYSCANICDKSNDLTG